MDKPSILFEKWQSSGKAVAVSFLIFLSLGSVHYTTFFFSIPVELRALLDLSFKATFAANFFIVMTFSIVCARYIPQALLAVGAFAIESSISIIYYRRGYRRVASTLGIFERDRIKDKAERREFEKRLRSFGRKDARMDNFIRGIIQRRLPILFYETHKAEVTAQLAVLLGLFFYVGFTLACYLFALAVFLNIAMQTYVSFSDRFRFNLMRPFRGDDPSYEPDRYPPSAKDLLLALVTCAVAIAIAGPLRLQHMIREPNVSISYDSSEINAALIGPTAHGLVLFDQDFGFIPFSAISEIRKISDSE